MDITEVYRNMTHVDLQEQMRIWDERGKGYYGEFCVFSKLYLSMDEKAKYLMNLHLPTDDGGKTELDLVMLHSTGIYIFEVKHYKGTIYGNTDDSVWTQFFKTKRNNTFINPVQQNGYHIRAMRRMFADVPIFSVVVFSNPEVSLHINNNNHLVLITSISNLVGDLNHYLSLQPMAMNDAVIEDVFGKLAEFSALEKEHAIERPVEIASFNMYINNLIADTKEAIQNEKKNAERKVLQAETYSRNAIMNADQCVKDAQKREISNKKQYMRSLAILLAVSLFVIFCIFINYSVKISEFEETYEKKIDAYELDYQNKLNDLKAEYHSEYLKIQSEAEEKIKKAENELKQMKKNFQKVELFNGGSLDFKDNFIEVSEVSLKKSNDLDGTAIFSCRLTNTGEEYGILLTKETKFIIMFADGTVQEYEMFGKRLNYIESSNRLSGSALHVFYKQSDVLKPLEIHGVTDVNDIVYIKINNVSIWKANYNNGKSISDGHEIELYTK